jgi:xylan 1,4-beta-xylosidase
VWGQLREDGQDWPTEEQWELLRKADQLEEIESRRTVTADGAGVVVVETDMPMPSMSELVMTPL